MRPNASIIKLVILCSVLSSQERTALNIICDTRNIPIYVDGHFMGNTPLNDYIDVTPGWHKVSFFPEISNDQMGTRKISQNILRLGTQDVLVEIGETVRVTMTYEKLNQDVEAYQNSIRSGSLLGFSMILATIMILMWAYV